MDIKPVKVLLIEDDQTFVNMVQQMLSKAKTVEFEVDTTSDLSSSLKYLDKNKVNVILLDLGLPDSRELATFDKIYKKAPEIPIVILTALDEEEISIEAIKRRAQDYIFKSDVSPNMLVHSIRYAIERNRLEMELKKHKDSLEVLVDERTAELKKSNEELQKEVVVRKQAMNAFRGSEERFRNLAEHIPGVSIQGYKTDGTVFYWNEASEKVYGYTAEEAVGKNLGDLIVPPDLKPIFQECLKVGDKIKKSGEFMPAGELMLLHKKGHLVPVYSIHTAVYITGKEPLLFCIDVDLSERKKAEEAVRESAELLRATLESTADGILVVDENGKVTHKNARFAEMWKIPKDILETSEDKKLLDYVLSQLKDPQAFLMKVEELYSSVDESFDTIEFKDGHIFERFSCPLVKNSKVKKGRVWSFRDVTERKRAEEERKVMHRLLQRLTEPLSFKETGQVIAEEVRNLFKNDFFSFSYYDFTKKMSVEMYCEDTPLGASDPAEMPPTNIPIDKIKERPTYFGESMLINRPEEPKETEFIPVGDKTRLARSLMFAPIRWGNSTVGVISVQSYTPGKYNDRDLNLFEDITSQCGGVLLRNMVEDEKRKVETRIQEAHRFESLGALADGVANRFNNLISIILGNISLVMMDLMDSPVRDKIGEIEESALRASELTEQMLTYTGKTKFNIESLDLSKIIKGMTSLLEVSVSENVTLKYSLAETLPLIRGDSSQIRHVVSNLIINASESFDENEGTVTISTGTMKCDRGYLDEVILGENLTEGTYIYLEITDTGCGMDKETIERIFDPFFSTKSAGRGLGLAAVLGIIRGHNGALKVYSDPGKGTSFTVLFRR